MMRALRSHILIALGIMIMNPAYAHRARGASRITLLLRIAAPPEDGALPLYPKRAPGSEARRETEVWKTVVGNRVVRNVADPTVTPFLPAPDKATGAAVITDSGGGFKLIAMDGDRSICSKEYHDGQRSYKYLDALYRLSPGVLLGIPTCGGDPFQATLPNDAA